MKITLSITLPDDLAQKFMQHIRDFDTKYDPHHEDKVLIQMLGVGDQTAEQMEEFFGTIRPRLELMHTFKADS